MKILIIDDDFYIVEDIRLNTDWKKLGIDGLYTAHSIQEAKHVAEQYPDLDIVLTDIEMPRENGFDFIHWLHEKNLNPVVLLLTGHEKFDYARSAVKLHVLDYLTKPVDISCLEHALSRAVRESKRRKLYPELFRISPETGSKESTIEIIQDCIRKNLSSPELNRQLIAEFVHMNPDYISSIFSRKTGESLTSFILKERLKAARVMLATTDYSLQEISYRTGFSSPSYFHRQFKKSVGVTPKRYRVNEKKNNGSGKCD